MTVRDSITRTGARTPGAEDYPTSMAAHGRASHPTQCGITEVASMCARGRHKPNISRCMPGAGLSRPCAGRCCPTCQPSSRIGENPPYGMIGRVEETSASFEARSAPRLYPTRGSGQYLYDRTGVCYLDLLSGFGVFAIGRNHAVLRDALKSVLESELPNLVQMDVSTLAGILAEQLLARVPYLDKVFFANSGAESVE